MYNPYVRCIKKGDKEESYKLFSELRKGDSFVAWKSCAQWVTVGEDAHESGDSSYSGYLLYDENGEAWFADDAELAVKRDKLLRSI